MVSLLEICANSTLSLPLRGGGGTVIITHCWISSCRRADIPRDFSRSGEPGLYKNDLEGIERTPVCSPLLSFFFLNRETLEDEWTGGLCLPLWQKSLQPSPHSRSTVTGSLWFE